MAGPVLNRYRELEAQGWSAAAISRQLQAEFPDEAPADERTIQRYVKEDRSLDASGPWRLWMSEPEDWPPIFQTLTVVIEVSDGETRWFSAAEVEWLTRLMRANRVREHREDPFAVYLLARQLARAQAAGDERNYTTDVFYALASGLLEEFPVEDGTARGYWADSARHPRKMTTK